MYNPNKHFEDSAKRCVFGVIPDLSNLIEEFAYYTSPRRSRISDPITYPKDMFFFNGENKKVQTFVAPGPGSAFLVCRPAKMVLESTKIRCSEGKIGAFHLTPWSDNGHFLLRAVDKSMIASIWLAFIPASGVLDINPTNTKIVL